VLTPMPRTTHLVSNIEVQPGEDGDYTVQAAFVCIEHQADKQRIYSGRHIYHLAPADDSFRIRLKRVDLVNCDGTHVPMAIPL